MEGEQIGWPTSGYIIAALLIIGFLWKVWESHSYRKEIREVSSMIAKNIVKENKKTVVILDFTDIRGERTELGRFIAREISGELVNIAQDFRVVSREQACIDKILQEYKLYDKYKLVKEAAIKLGEFLGADSLVVGTVVPSDGKVKIQIDLLDCTTAEIISAISKEIPQTDPIKKLLKK